MAFLEDFVDSNKGLECLDLVGEDGLPVMLISQVPATQMHTSGMSEVFRSPRPVSDSDFYIVMDIIWRMRVSIFR